MSHEPGSAGDAHIAEKYGVDRQVERYELSIGPVPYRKSEALGVTTYYCEGGAVWDVLAYFRSPEAAELTRKLLNEWPPAYYDDTEEQP